MALTHFKLLAMQCDTASKRCSKAVELLAQSCQDADVLKSVHQMVTTMVGEQKALLCSVLSEPERAEAQELLRTHKDEAASEQTTKENIRKKLPANVDASLTTMVGPIIDLLAPQMRLLALLKIAMEELDANVPDFELADDVLLSQTDTSLSLDPGAPPSKEKPRAQRGASPQAS